MAWLPTTWSLLIGCPSVKINIPVNETEKRKICELALIDSWLLVGFYGFNCVK